MAKGKKVKAEKVVAPKEKKITLAEKAEALHQDLSLTNLLNLVIEIAKKVE